MRKTESRGPDPSPSEIRASRRNRDETNGGKMSDIRQFVNPEKPSNGTEKDVAALGSGGMSSSSTRIGEARVDNIASDCSSCAVICAQLALKIFGSTI